MDFELCAEKVLSTLWYLLVSHIVVRIRDLCGLRYYLNWSPRFPLWSDLERCNAHNVLLNSKESICAAPNNLSLHFGWDSYGLIIMQVKACTGVAEGISKIVINLMSSQVIHSWSTKTPKWVTCLFWAGIKHNNKMQLTNLVENKCKMYLKYIYFMLSILKIYLNIYVLIKNTLHLYL